MIGMKLQGVPTFSRIRVTDWGSVHWIDDFPGAIDDVVTVWTQCQSVDNPFATVEVRGVLDRHAGLVWLPDDAEAEIVEQVRYAGMPEDLVLLATPIEAPAGSKGTVKSADGWPELNWTSNTLYSPVQGFSDPELSVQTILCALNVAPDEGDLRPMLLAALAARYAKVLKNPDTYPPERYPWRNGPVVDADTLAYLRG